MEGDLKRRGDACPQLLDLIPNEKGWKVREASGGGEEGNGFGVAEGSRALQLSLGPPGCESYCPKYSNTSTDLSIGAKRAFLDTVKPKAEGFKQQLLLQQKQSYENPAHADPKSAAGDSNSTHTRAVSVPVVGWPPIRTFRKNIACCSSKPSVQSQNIELQNGEKLENHRKGLLLKINMDGIPIGRKVDLKANDSYEKLSSVVEVLFRDLLTAQRGPSTSDIKNEQEKQAFAGLLDGSGEYTLVYEDNEGDRMLVGDVPWEMFVSTAKRLRVFKSSELSAASLRAVSKRRTATDC